MSNLMSEISQGEAGRLATGESAEKGGGELSLSSERFLLSVFFRDISVSHRGCACGNGRADEDSRDTFCTHRARSIPDRDYVSPKQNCGHMTDSCIFFDNVHKITHEII